MKQAHFPPRTLFAKLKIQKTLRSLLFILSATFLCSFGAYSQAITVSGQIQSAAGKSISAASISLLRNSDTSSFKSTLTDAAGNYRFSNLPAGEYRIKASAVYFKTKTSEVFTISNSDNEKFLAHIQLNPEEKTLAAVTVASRKPFIERKADKTIINVDAAITTAGSTAMEVLEKSPGIAVDKDGNISFKGKQGVIVLIDGKQTYMSAQDLANYLQSMPAVNLDQIELMASPSSKYDASGRSGVINIKTKKNRQKGFNGSVNLSFGQGKYSRGTTALNLNYRTGKFNLFSNLSASYRKNAQTLNIHREYFTAPGTRDAIFDQEAQFIKERNNDNAKMGLDFYASKKTTFGIVISGYVTPFIQHSTNTSFLKDGSGNINSILYTASADNRNFKNGSVNFNFSHAFDSTGNIITADADILKYRSKHRQQFNSDNFTPLWVKQSSESLVSQLPSDINVYSFKTDFVQPFKNGSRLEAGLKASYVNTDNVAGYFNVINGASIIDNEKTNHFKYEENINAAYVNFNRDIKKWSLQSGLRLENTNYKGRQLGNALQPDSAFRKSYTGLFPTLYAGYKLNANNEFGFSYGRRISRPDYEDLNPFIFFIDKYTYEAGNPFLRPMYANVFELSHTFHKNFTTTLNYTHSKDKFNEYFEQAGYATIVKQNNYGSINEVSLSVNAEIQPVKSWTILPYAEFNYNEVNSELNAFKLRTSGAGFSANLTNRLSFKKGWGAEVSGMYRSKMRVGQFEINGLQQMSAGVSKQVLKSKATLKLNVNDIFYSNRQSGVIHIENTLASFHQKNDTRFVTAGFSYRFGKPLKNPQRRTGGAGEEQNRIRGN